MVSNLFFYQLALIALLWLCLLLHYAWPSDRAAIRPLVTPPRRKRHRNLKSFEGLTKKPHCDACELGSDLRPESPPHTTPAHRAHAGATPPGGHLHPFLPEPRLCPIAAGSAGAISAPMAIPVAVPGGSCCVSPVAAIFFETLGTLFHGKRTSRRAHRTRHCVPGRRPGHPGARRGCSRWTRIRSCTGWSKRQSSSGPAPDTSCTTYKQSTAFTEIRISRSARRATCRAGSCAPSASS